MTFFPWSNDYSVGIRLIDNDHKDLVDTVNDLHDAVQAQQADEAVTRALAMLATYVQEHFAREEKLMADYGYPGLAAHKAQHAALHRKVHAIRLVHVGAPLRLDPARLLDFLRDWLVRHILQSDLQYVPYMIGDAGRAAGSSQGETARQTGAAEPRESEMVEVTLKVPADKVEALRRCALLLRRGGEKAQNLEDLADPLENMTLEEALEEIAPLLRRPGA